MLISFEGIDGSGKSTQLVMLREVLEDRGLTVVVIREPGATLLSESIREILLSTKQTITPTAELLLFSAARTQPANAQEQAKLPCFLEVGNLKG